MNAQELIAAYERILGTTGRMLEAARKADWDGLIELEQACRVDIDRVVGLGGDMPRLPEELQRRRAEIIRGVLDADAQIRDLTQPWMAQLEQLIGATRNSRRLSGSYGVSA
jgi:flagellar protein FliT